MSKTKSKKPNLSKALKRVDQSPSHKFGNIDVDISSLPCLTKIPKEKITANFDTDLLSVIRGIAQKHDISYTNLMNDALRKVFGLL